ncbi:MAG: hypothetical protein WBX11_17735 [Thiobacillaceae bacterium]
MNDTFLALIAASVVFGKQGLELAAQTEDFPEAMQQIADGAARLELRISFDPLPVVTGVLIRSSDDQVIGQFFRKEATAAPETAH